VTRGTSTPLERLRETFEEPAVRQVGLWGLILIGTVVVGAIIGTILGGGGGGSSGASEPITGFRPAATGELIDAPKAQPKALDEPRGMGAQKAGIAIVAMSEVDSVQTSTGKRNAPAGSRMIAFRVADWQCETDPCDGWSTLDPVIDIGGTQANLTPKDDTYVVVVPPGTDEVSLVIDADDIAQSLSLLDEDSDGDNIALLAAKGLTDAVPIHQSFRLPERTSIQLTGPDGQLTDTFFRTVNVGEAQRHFFFNGATPQNPADCFLVITVAYTYDGQQQQSAFDPAEVTFVANGTTYKARDLDPSEDRALLGFEVPTSLKKGVFTLGGVVSKVSTTGVPYDTTLATKQIKVTLAR
jgi:hypothetical protein